MGPTRKRTLSLQPTEVTQTSGATQLKRVRTLSLPADTVASVKSSPRRQRELSFEAALREKLSSKKVQGWKLPSTEGELTKLPSLKKDRAEDSGDESASTSSEFKDEPRGRKERAAHGRLKRALQQLVTGQMAPGMTFWNITQ